MIDLLHGWIAVSEYAEHKAKTGNVKNEEALDFAKQEFAALWPNGIHTADTHIFSVTDTDNHVARNLYDSFGFVATIS